MLLLLMLLGHAMLTFSACKRVHAHLCVRVLMGVGVSACAYYHVHMYVQVLACLGWIDKRLCM